MKETMRRRDFLQRSLLGSAGAIFMFPKLSSGMSEDNLGKGVCLALASHWSYIGIGWQLGLESCVLSVIDTFGMADSAPGVKTCINLDARAYELIAQRFPEVSEKLKKYLDAGKVELIGGTFAQPMGSYISGESNIRQIVYGRETIRKALGYEMVTFLEEEEFTHPQLPQILIGSGFRYASLAQVDTWGRSGIPPLELNVFHWKGMDGTTIPSTPKNSLFSYGLQDLASLSALKTLQTLGKPLVINWAEFGWEPHETPAYLSESEKYKKLSEKFPIEYVTLKEYMEKYATDPRQTVYLNMDAWKKLLPWGIGGDQLRILDRKVEALLLAAERFDAVASSLGTKTKERSLEAAWKDLLTAQSHDVSLCEYSRWQSDRMAPLDRSEDFHNFAWGVIGYNHLDAAQKEAQAILDLSVGHIAGQVGSQVTKQGHLAATVLNPCGWERTEVVLTGRIYPAHEKAKDVLIKDSSGRLVPSQIVKSERDDQGNLIVANVAFLAEKVPSVGYDTYYLELLPGLSQSPTTDLRIDEQRLELENEYLKIKLGSTHGAITSLFDKTTGQEILDGQKCPFPVFKGRPNQDYPLRSAFVQGKYPKQDMLIPPLFDSSKSVALNERNDQGDWRAISKSTIRWIEKGPVRATVKTSHYWPLLKFETYVTVTTKSPRVEVTSRVLAEIPPALDTRGADGRFPVEIKEGYWLSFAPNFQTSAVLRDFPFGVEPTSQREFHALTFADLVGGGNGLLLLHPGTQYFKWDTEGIFSNLVMREWESFFTGEYGWPRYAEYRHALIPHGAGFTHADCVRASAEFTQRLITVVGQPQKGSLPKRKSFITVGPDNVQLSAFRKKRDLGYELRVVEAGGQEAGAAIELGFPVNTALETNLLGSKVAELPRSGARLDFRLQPWKIRTFELT